jgi:hypothetical protein
VRRRLRPGVLRRRFDTDDGIADRDLIACAELPARLVSAAPFTRTPPLAISTLAAPPLPARPVALSSASRAM